MDKKLEKTSAWVNDIVAQAVETEKKYDMDDEYFLELVDDQERERIMNEYLSYMMGIDPE